MSAYTTKTISKVFAVQFLVGKIMTASDSQLEELMNAYGDEEPFYLNNFRVVDSLPEEK